MTYNYQQFGIETTQAKARHQLFTQIKKLAPKVLTDLRKVFRFASKTELSDADILYLTDVSKTYADILQGRADLPLITELTEFEGAFLLWANQYAFIDDWMIYEALNTLESWKNINDRDNWSFTLLPAELHSLEESFVPSPFEPFNPKVETEASYRTRFQNYQKAQAEDFLTRQFAKPSFEIHKPNPVVPFEYLIKRNILRTDWRSISSNSGGASQQAITTAISRLSKTLGFTEQKADVKKNIHQILSHKNKKSV